MYFRLIPRKRKKKKRISASDAIGAVDRLGEILSGNLRRDELGDFGASVFRADTSDNVPSRRLDWDLLFPPHETEVARVRRQRIAEIEGNYRQNTL
jgi:hypothetical protein